MKLMIIKEHMMYEGDDKKRPHDDEGVRSGRYFHLLFHRKKTTAPIIRNARIPNTDGPDFGST